MVCTAWMVDAKPTDLLTLNFFLLNLMIFFFLRMNSLEAKSEIRFNTVNAVNIGESVIWLRRHYLFTVAETGRGIIYGVFFFLFFSVSSRKDKMNNKQ